MQSLSPALMLDSFGQVASTIALIALATVLLEAGLYLLFAKWLRHKYALPIMLLAPAAIGLAVLIVYPIAYQFRLAFSNMSLKRFQARYTVTEASLATLEAAQVPDAVLASLRGFKDREFATVEDFTRSLEKLLGPEQAAAYREQIVKQAQKKAQYSLPREAFDALQRANLPPDVLAALEEISGQPFKSCQALLGEIENTIGSDRLARYRTVLEDQFQETTRLSLTKIALLKLHKAGLPEAVLARLNGVMNQDFTKPALLQTLRDMLGDQADVYQTLILDHAEFSGPTFGLAEGLANLKTMLTAPVLKQIMFFPLLLQTLLWTFVQVASHVTLGMGVALLLNRPLKLRGLYRTLIVVPWALPPVVAILAWRGEFHYEYGFINVMLTSLGFEGIQWKVNPVWNFVAMNITNIWLGVPFMAVILLGGLQSISTTYYDAADVDGATAWQRFRHITLPLIQPVMTPAVILGVIWTFNNFNVPYFINEYELESSDILVTALFRAAFEYNRYGFAAMFAFIIFLILLGFCLIYIKLVNVNLGIANRRR